MDRDALIAQQLQRLRAGLQRQLHAPGQHDDLAALFQQLGHVRGLDAGDVVRAGFGPVPPTAAAGVELEVAARADALDLHAAPGEVRDPRRTRRFRFHRRLPPQGSGTVPAPTTDAAACPGDYRSILAYP